MIITESSSCEINIYPHSIFYDVNLARDPKTFKKTLLGACETSLTILFVKGVEI